MQTVEIFMYKTGDGQTSIDVKLENKTIWLSLHQISDLFGKDKSVIPWHLKNIYIEGKLDFQTTVAKNATVQKEWNREIKREIDYYNLVAILSVGYRVNSDRGTQFRIWANKILRDYLVKGYAINERQLKEQADQLEQLKQTVKLLGNMLEKQSQNSDEANGLLKVITDYTYALDVLDRYDHQVLEIKATTSTEIFRINYEEAM